jgi:hypothetical protein
MTTTNTAPVKPVTRNGGQKVLEMILEEANETEEDILDRQIDLTNPSTAKKEALKVIQARK